MSARNCLLVLMRQTNMSVTSSGFWVVSSLSSVDREDPPSSAEDLQVFLYRTKEAAVKAVKEELDDYLAEWVDNDEDQEVIDDARLEVEACLELLQKPGNQGCYLEVFEVGYFVYSPNVME